MQIDPEEIAPGHIYSLLIRAITPRPIAWVSTISPSGVANVAPFSYFTGVGSSPASLLFSCANLPDGSAKDTIRNLTTTPQFVVNVVPYRLAESMVKTSFGFDYGISEFEEAGLHSQPSKKILPPRVAESPIQMECEVLQIVNVGEGAGSANVVIGKIVLFDIADEVLNAEGKIDPAKVDSIGRMGGREYCRTTDCFELN